MIGDLIMKLLHTRTNAHVLHLKSRSYAQHVALGEFYDALPDFADRIAEAHQGMYGLIETYPPTYRHVDDPQTLVGALGDWVEANRYKACEKDDTALQNIIDELLAQCATTAYKLRFLK